MATVTEIQRDTAYLVAREPRNVFVFFMREVAQLGDLTTAVPVSTLRDVAQLNDLTTDRVIPLARDTALLSSTALPSVRRTRVEREVAQLSSSVQYGVRVTQTLHETATLNDTASGSASPLLHDTALLNSSAYPAVTTRSTLRDTARLRGSVVSVVSLTVRDVAQLNDAVDYGAGTSLTVRDTAQLNDAVTRSTKVRVVVREAGQLSSQLAATLHALFVQRDTAFLMDTATPPSYGRAYTCSIASWGLSTFSNFPFRTMAGTLAAGDNLWRLDAADDYGTPITSYIKTGILDIGTSAAKRLAAVYAAGSSDAPMFVSVTADVDGTRETYDYDMELRDQSDYRNNRALVGKGFRGRFVQFKIGGTAVKYTLLTAEADVAMTTRRL